MSKIVMYESDEAAKHIAVEGWMSRDGYFYGKNEHAARYRGCTHKKCICGNTMKKWYSKCDKCITKSTKERYNNLPFKEWDHKTPLTLWDNNIYFWSEDDITDYIHENELNPKDLMLLWCEPQKYREVEFDYWEDVIPECGTIDEKLTEAIETFNKTIRSLGVASWTSTNIRTEYKPKH